LRAGLILVLAGYSTNVMKKISNYSVIIFLLIVSCFYACEKTDEGPDTNSDRDKFLGSWQGTSTGPGGTRNFNMNFTASSSAPDQILISNFDGAGNNTFIAANVGGNSFALVHTQIGSDIYEGSGTYNSNNTLSFTFTIDDGQTVENRTGSAHK
jgi:hypothetical protein